MKCKKSFCCGVVLLTAALPGIALSAVYEVSPSSDSDCSDGKCSLQAALDAAELNNGEDNTLRLTQGEYIGNFSYFPSGDNIGGLTISGGWNADFSAQVLDPTNTILNGNNSGTVLNLKVEDISNPAVIKGDLKVEGVTITKGKAFIGGGLIALTAVPSRLEINNCILENNHADDAAGGCAIGVYDLVSTTLGGETYLLNNIIRNNDVIINAAGCVVISSGLAVISNNLIYGNTAENTTSGDSPDAGGLDLNPLAGNYYLVNNTIVDNQVIAQADSDASSGGIRLEPFEEPLGSIHAYLYNNIIFNNSVSTGIGDDIGVYIDNAGISSGSSLDISHSAYGDLWVATGSDSVVPTLTNNTTSDPLLSMEPSTLYNLTSSSPCIDTGLSSAPYLPENDLAGNLRELDGDKDGNSIVDMGCYEYNDQKAESNVWTLFLPAILSGRDVPSADVPTVTSATGQVWMDRNLGASRVATSIDDEEAYGDLYQWGRLKDGHEKRTSSTTETLSSSDIPGHDKFILSSDDPHDWRMPQNGNLWQGMNGVNNPCPAGFRLPSADEWQAEINQYGSTGTALFDSPLKLVAAGYRYRVDGSLSLVGSVGSYWSSTVDYKNSRRLYFNSNGVAGIESYLRAFGFSIRCLKD